MKMTKRNQSAGGSIDLVRGLNSFGIFSGQEALGEIHHFEVAVGGHHGAQFLVPSKCHMGCQNVHRHTSHSAATVQSSHTQQLWTPH